MSDLTSLSDLRITAAEAAYQDFDFDVGCTPDADGGWEDDGLGQLSKVLFVPDEDNPHGPTLKGVFSVTFDEGSATANSVWATLDGNDIGRRPVAITPAPRL
jgi:hypothetical protein